MAEPKPLPIIRPLMGEPEAEAARRAILSGWVTQGPEVAAFEREFAAFVGAPHACAVSSATTALHLALLACGVSPGDEVVTVSHSFIATANCIRYCGATPVFCDVDPATLNLDPRRLEALIGPRTRAVLCVHQVGMPCDLEAILGVARRRGLKVIEDAACAAGSEVRVGGRWERIGRPHGDVACFSFHPRKLLTTGDGGMLTTADPAWDARFRLLRQHGMSVPDTVRHGSPTVVFESYPILGYNYRMTDIQAAVGREQLKRLPGVVERRRRLAEGYGRALAGVPVTPPAEPEDRRSNWQSYGVRLPDGADQKAVMQRLLDAGIATRRGIQCIHREPAYPRAAWKCACGGEPCSCLRESERAQDRCILLPLFDGMTEDDQARVASALASALPGR